MAGIHHGAVAFTELFGENLLTKEGLKSTTEVLSHKELLDAPSDDPQENKLLYGIYFSAHWCPPCRTFTPKLVECYNKIKEAGKEFEIVFVSFDRDQQSFEDYYSGMPWRALPFDSERKEVLSEKYGVSGIPALILLNDDGSFKLKNGRDFIDEDPTGAEYPW